MSRAPGIPPRVGTAPMLQESKARATAGLTDFRSGAPVPRPPLAAGLPRAGPGLPAKAPAAAGGKTPAPEPSAGDSKGSSPSSVEKEVTAGGGGAGYEGDSYPEDCMYDISQFIALRQSTKPLSEYILEYAGRLWKMMPEHMSSLQNSSLRDSLFKEENATMPSKVLADRKLHNEVLGILGKVTDSNLERMKRELTDLPIRQSTQEEIREVIDTFFRKCVRPEDSRYTPLYVQLIKHLVNTIGEHEPAGRMIRTEIIFKCRDVFVNAPDLSRQLEDRIANLPAEEAELERMVYTGKQKANVQFLGLMFNAGMTTENVVLTVLESLLYAERKNRRVVPAYCVVHFMELMQTCGPHMSRGAYETAIPRFVRDLIWLQRTHPESRIRFLTANFLETMGNNWVPLHGRGAAAPGTQARAGQGNPPPPGFTVIVPDLKDRIPDREEFWKVMDDYFITSEVDEIKGIIETIPEEVQIVYISKWIGRYITTYKYTTERSRIGELFEQLAAKNIVTVATARAALKLHAKSAIEEDLFTDQPKYFTHWAAVIKHGRTVFPPSLHTTLLDMLVAAHAAVPTIAKMISDVSKTIDESAAKGEQKESNLQERFRVLQALLRYTPPLLHAGSTADDDLDCEMYMDEHGNRLNIIEAVAATESDAEVNMFKVLCDSYHDEKKSEVLTVATEALKKTHNAAYPLFSAFFTFVRYDVDTLCMTHKDVLKKICSTRPLPNLLEEAYVQWTRLGGSDAHYTHFVRRVVAICGTGKSDPVDKLKERLRAEYSCEKLIFVLEKAMKS